jgi:5-dehydro-2-deoxygluconokinase
MTGFDLIAFGRSTIDLYSQNAGSPFEEIKGFNAFVGGSPLNMCVGAQRLGLQTALISAVGDEKVADFILNYLKKEGVNSDYVPRLANAKSTAVLLGIEKDRFPLVYYRDNAADYYVDIDLVNKAPIAQSKVFAMTGTALAKEPSRSAAFWAAEIAQKNGVKVVFDIDFRADQWHDVRAFGIVARSFLPFTDIVLGTEEELLALMLTDKEDLAISHQQISAPEIKGNVQKGIEFILEQKTELLVMKSGANGCTLHFCDKAPVTVTGFPVEVYNVLGAGDGFAGGFIYGLVQGWDYYRTSKLANACGAWLVTKPGCSNFAPTMQEIQQFIEKNGGWE